MNWLLRVLNDYWFAEASARRLASVRFLVGAFAFQYLALRYSMFSRVAATSPELFDPVGLAALLAQPISVQAFQIILTVTLLLNVAFILGWRHRYTGPAFALLLLWVMCYRNSWSMVYHTDNVLVLHALILGLTRSADAFSLDALARRVHPAAQFNVSGITRGVAGAADSLRGWQYGWALRLLCVITVSPYFLAGVVKVLGPLGFAWVSGEAMRSQMAVDGLRKEFLGSGAAPLTFMLYDEVWLFTIIGVTTLALELGSPLALFNKWIGRLWAISIIGMHWGILFVMDIKFEYSLSGFIVAAFLPLEQIVEWFQLRIGKARSDKPPLLDKAPINHQSSAV